MTHVHVSKVPVSSIAVEIQELLKEHWDELATDKQRMVLNPNWDTYFALENRGDAYAVEARVDGKLVGYTFTVMQYSMHYSELGQGINDVLFISKPYRRSGVGGALMNETTRLAKEQGAGVYVWRAKPGSPLSKLLKLNGLGVQDETFLEPL